jgi:signal peptidase II
MKRKYLILFSLSGLVLCCDQLSKHLVTRYLEVGVRHPVISSLVTVEYKRNNGFAFGLLQKAPASTQNLFFVGVPVFALILIILIFIKLQDNQVLTSLALTTILAGAVGNLVDRLHYGYVVDFLDILKVTSFNIADVSIIVGVILMFIGTWSQSRNQEIA